MKAILFFCFISFSSLNAQIAPVITPLPDDQIEILFSKIEKKEVISFDLLIQALNSQQTTLRAYAASLLGDKENIKAIPYLIDTLSDDSSHEGANYSESGWETTRFRANLSLKKLTKKDFGYIWNSPKELRVLAIRKWVEWWKNKKA
jgi:HEAT repeat protein